LLLAACHLLLAESCIINGLLFQFSFWLLAYCFLLLAFGQLPAASRMSIFQNSLKNWLTSFLIIRISNELNRISLYFLTTLSPKVLRDGQLFRRLNPRNKQEI
jgi:hypothetical protein